VTDLQVPDSVRKYKPAVTDEWQADHWFNGGQFDSNGMGRFLESEFHLRNHIDGLLYYYRDGAYHGNGDKQIRGVIRTILQAGDRWSTRRAGEVYGFIRNGEHTDFDTNPGTGCDDRNAKPRYINCANGLLDWDRKTPKLIPHTPEFFTPYQIPVPWDPDASCDAIDGFLDQVIPDKDTQRTVLQAMAAAIFPAPIIEQFLVLHGPGGNGKSILLELFLQLVGTGNFSSIPIQDFSENRFAKARLHRKLANVCGDLDARAMRFTGEIKQLLGGDPINAEHKGRDGFEFWSIALQIYACNEIPTSRDHSLGLFDRFAIIHMLQRIRGTKTQEQKAKLVARLLKDGALSGLLNKVVAELRSLYKQGSLYQSPSVIEAVQQYKTRTDSVRSFVDEYCRISGLIDAKKGLPALHVDRRLLYQSYTKFCEDEKRHPFSAPQFYAKVHDTICDVLGMQLSVEEIYKQRRGVDSKVVRMAHYINLTEAVEFNERNPKVEVK
jgi:putative DNA primase/helicase